jgi:V8-like Glu-specific endopeptidase
VFIVPHTDFLPQANLPAAIALAARKAGQEEQIFCSGVPLSPDLVLTAAHCVNQFEKRWRESTLFIRTPSLPSQTIDVVHWALHPQYQESMNKKGLDIDLALLKLKEPLKEFPQSTKRMLIIPQARTQTRLWMRGFSPIRLKTSTSWQALQSSETWSKLNFQAELSSEGKYKVRAEQNNAAPCPGDSGAPVWSFEREKATLEGIVVQGNCEKGDAKVVSMNPALAWLESKMHRFSEFQTNRLGELKIYPLRLFEGVRRQF